MLRLRLVILAASALWMLLSASIAGAAPSRFIKSYDVVYGEAAGHQLTLDVISPANPEPGSPMVIFVHGGGWWQGDKQDMHLKRPMMQAFARRGFITVSVNYRLACGTAPGLRVALGVDFAHASPLCGGYRILDQVEDVQAAVRYLRAHAHEMGSDYDRIGLFGVSAGGHLALLAAATAAPDEIVRAVSNWGGPPQTAFIAGQNPASSGSIVASFSNAAGCLLHDTMECSEVWRQLTPEKVITRATPPFAVQGMSAAGELQVPPLSHFMMKARLHRIGWSAEAMVAKRGCHGAGCVSSKIVRGDRAGYSALAATIGFFEQYI